MTEKKLPPRAASRGQFIFWQIVAFLFIFMGFQMLMGGAGAGLIMVLGGFGMSVREAGLRSEYKRRLMTQVK